MLCSSLFLCTRIQIHLGSWLYSTICLLSTPKLIGPPSPQIQAFISVTAYSSSLLACLKDISNLACLKLNSQCPSYIFLSYSLLCLCKWQLSYSVYTKIIQITHGSFFPPSHILYLIYQGVLCFHSDHFSLTLYDRPITIPFLHDYCLCSSHHHLLLDYCCGFLLPLRYGTNTGTRRVQCKSDQGFPS